MEYVQHQLLVVLIHVFQEQQHQFVGMQMKLAQLKIPVVILYVENFVHLTTKIIHVLTMKYVLIVVFIKMIMEITIVAQTLTVLNEHQVILLVVTILDVAKLQK